MQLDAPFARLPLQFDVARLQAEVREFEWFEWVPLRSVPRGYGTIELISSLGRSMDVVVAPFLPTAYLDRCPYIKQVLASVPGVHYAAHLRWLGPGARVSRHWDGQFYAIHRARIHIPIVTSERSLFSVGDKQIHMGAGEVWLFDRHSYHVADNEGDCDRIHLTVDMTPDPDFLELVARAYRPFNGSGRSGEETPALVRYSADSPARIRTQRMADGPGNSPAELDVMVAELVGLMRRNPIRDEERARAVERHLERFRIEWRCLWAQFGCTQEGWPSYLGLARETLASLRETEGDGAHPLVGEDVPVWKRLRDYLFLGILSSRGVRSIMADADVPDLDERFVVPDVLLRFAGVARAEVYIPRQREFVPIRYWHLVLLAHIASHERLPEDAYQGPDGEAARAAIAQLLEWELILPQKSAPRPACEVELAELGAGGDLLGTVQSVPVAAPPELERTAARVNSTTRLRLRGPAPYHARLRWRGYQIGMELLFLQPEGHTKVHIDALDALLHFAEAITPSDLSERLDGVSAAADGLDAIRSLVRSGVLEIAD